MIMNAQLPQRCAQGPEAVASVTIVHYTLASAALAMGAAHISPSLAEWYLKRVCMWVTSQQLQISYSHFSPLPHAADSRRCFLCFPADTK